MAISRSSKVTKPKKGPGGGPGFEDAERNRRHNEKAGTGTVLQPAYWRACPEITKLSGIVRCHYTTMITGR
jgi:hypothetical protein